MLAACSDDSQLRTPQTHGFVEEKFCVQNENRVPGSYERMVLLKLLGMSEGEYKQYWIAQVFHGDAQVEPVALFSNGMQKEVLLAFPGAIALVVLQDVKPGMKIVKVEGRSPGEPGYPVH
jgi:hypothetical protein